MAVNETWKRRLIARHPVLDFVNTLDGRFAPTGPEERLSHDDELLDFLHASALLTLPQMHVLRRLPADPPASIRILRRVKLLREKLASIMYVFQAGPPSPESLRELEIEFTAARRHLALKWTRGINGHAFWDLSFSAPTESCHYGF